MRIRRALAGDRAPLAALRAALWPDAAPGETDGVLAGEDYVAFVAEETESLLGFVEVSLRRDPLPDAAPVGYLEGWFVVSGSRRSGIGRALVRAAEEWAASRGCTEMASDAVADNDLGRAAHRALGFVEREAVVRYAKRIAPRILPPR